MDFDRNNKKRIFRHGDILIREVESIPKSVIPINTKILAEGEQTGHHHKLIGSFQIFQENDSLSQNRFLEIMEETTLTHQEHHQITIPVGKYVVVHERQHNPLAQVERVQNTWSDSATRRTVNSQVED